VAADALCPTTAACAVAADVLCPATAECTARADAFCPPRCGEPVAAVGLCATALGKHEAYAPCPAACTRVAGGAVAGRTECADRVAYADEAATAEYRVLYVG
jgi:hypothetical protein